MQWQRSMFGTTKAEIQRVRSQLDVVWRQPNSENTTATYHLLMSQLDSLLSREEAFWKQRSKVSWLKEGDRNTRLRDNTGRWREDEHGLQSVVLDYFTHLFTSSASGSEGEIIDAVESRVTPDMNNLLLADYRDAEIQEAVFQCTRPKRQVPMGCLQFFSKNVGILLDQMSQELSRTHTKSEASKRHVPAAPDQSMQCFV
ncbi:unnamed protein product [Prunus armeniaca]|uniref:Uncharacterized protein n=1 Tax=Prunus armeniaca TaxID=36596 RepID=A0A6J5WGT9_PRUAR|nr:unnamed protein product [Prunus armeniaca]CAB4299087.1 unnamed protein product [Prunus armeniaca]